MEMQFEKGIWIENPKFCNKVSRFRRSFSLDLKPKRAVLKITGLGWFVSRLNGTRTDNEYFKPLVSDYGERNFEGVNFYHPKSGEKRVYFHLLDVTNFLCSGENELSVDVANGWFCNTEKQIEGDYSYGTPRLIFELYWETDNEKGCIFSDENTKVQNLPLYATIFRGEIQDFQQDGEPCVFAKTATAPSGKLTLATIPCDKIRRILSPRVIKADSEHIILDFGVNHSGFLRGYLKGEKGGHVVIRYSEDLFSSSEIDHFSTSWGTQIQMDEYLLSGNKDIIETEFTYHGYRYAEISAPSGTEINLSSAEVNASLSQAGGFACNNEIINRIPELFRQTLLSNMHGGVPTDCPHRERRGFTGDGQVTATSAMYILDAEKFYRKWLQDILDSQQANGYVPHTAPYAGGGGGFGWGYAICKIPEILYRFTGDMQLVETTQPAILRWVEYMNSKRDKDYLLRREEDDWSLGDWFCADLVEIDPVYVNTCFFLKSVRMLLWFTRLLNKSVGQYLDLEENIKNSIIHNFYDVKTGSFANGTQGADALALDLEIVPTSTIAQTRQNLVSRYLKLGYLDTGIFCMLPVLEQLTLCGETELVFKLLTRTEYPSFGYMMERGATTLWECWSEIISPKYRLHDGILQDGYPVSHNHPMFGSVCAFLFEFIAGLNLREFGETHTVYFEPRFTRELSDCSAYRDTSLGRVSVSYHIDGEKIKVSLDAPIGVSVIAILPFADEKYQNLVIEGTGKPEIFQGIYSK